MHRARDLVQDTLLSAWLHLPELRRPELLRAWIYRVAYRNAMSSIRRRGPRGRPIVALGDGLAAVISTRPPLESPYWRVAGEWSDSEDLAPQLRVHLAGLPPRFSRPIELHYFARMGLVESAQVLGIPVPMLKMRLHRARELLRRRLIASEGARRFRSAPGHCGVAFGRPPPPPAPPTHPTTRVPSRDSARARATSPMPKSNGAA